MFLVVLSQPMSQTNEMHPVGEISQGVGEHVVLRSIDIVFNDGIEASKELDVFVSNKEKSAQWTNFDRQERTHRWSFKHGLAIFPDDKLTIRPLHSRLNLSHFTVLHRDHIDSFSIMAKDVISFLSDHSTTSASDELDYSEAPPGENSQITLKVFLRGFDTALVEVDTTSLRPDAKIEILESLSSSESLQEGVSQLRSVLSTIGANVEIVQNLENVLENVASIHPIAKAAVSALLIPYKLLKAEHEFKKDIQSLADEMRFLLKLLEDERWIAKLSSTKDTVMEIMKEVIDASLFINDFVNKGRFKQFGAAQTHSKLDEHVKCFEKLRKNFETAVNLQNAGLILQTASVVSKMADDDDDDRTQKLLLKLLAPAEQQPLGSLCLEGTRTKILADVEAWLKDANKRNIMWISGAPGAGKSTISATIVKKLLALKCARFFVKRGATPELRDPRHIWRTVAFALANMHRDVKNDIVKVLREKEAEYPNDAEVRDQFRDLLETTVQKFAESLSADRPYVVLIDALDECRTNDEDWSVLLDTLSEWSKLPSNVKLIVTSRNEEDIRDRLHAVSEHIVLETGDDISNETSTDIQLFFEAKFRGMGVLDVSWPGKDMIMRLTKQAAGLFIWAKTAVEYVGYRKWDPPRRLKNICDNLDKGSTDIDGLYGQVLFEIFCDMEDKERDVGKFVLAAVSLGKAPLAIQDLVELLAPEAGDEGDEASSIVHMAVEAFRPIINVRESDKVLSVCHKTLSDFLADEARMSEVIKQLLTRAQKPVDERSLLQYTMRYSEQNACLADACLRLMNKKLKFNIGHIPTSHCFNDAIPDRDKLVEEHIPRILLYACQHWAEHLDAVDGSISQSTILPSLKEFLWTHIMHWLEVLSFTDSTYYMLSSLVSAESYTKTRDDALSELARDAKRFVSMFHQVIARSAPHIYLSALPFTPSESKVAQVYGLRYPNTLSVLTGRLSSRSEMLSLAEMYGHAREVFCLAYLQDGKRIASGSDDCTVRLWDAHSGRVIAGAVFKHPGKVIALCPLPEVERVASICVDGKFRVWDVKEYQCISVIKVTEVDNSTFYMPSAAISPDGQVCGFISEDFDLEIRGTRDGQLRSCIPCTNLIGTFRIAFTMDGKSLICGITSSPNSPESIIFRNTKDGKIEDGTPILSKSARTITCLAVSADGLLFAAGMSGATIQLYKYPEREPLGHSMRHARVVLRVEFSKDGSLLASSSSDGTLCFWDTKTQELRGGPHRMCREAMYRGDAQIGALSFSPDGSRVAVAVGSTIEVLDVLASLKEVKRDSDVMSVICVAFDEHQRRFATGTYDGVVRVWDAHSGAMMPPVAEWVDDSPSDSKEINSLAFVQDGDLLVFSSLNGYVQKWDWKTGRLCQSLLIHDLQDARLYVQAISPDGKHMAVAYYASVEGGPDQVALWNYDTDYEVQRFEISGDLCQMAFSRDGAFIAFGTEEGKLEIWHGFPDAVGKDPARWSCSAKLEVCDVSESELLSIGFLPDAKRFATLSARGAGSQFHLWDIETQSKLQSIFEEEKIYECTFVSHSLDGDVIAVGSFDGVMRFWNMSTGQSIGKLAHIEDTSSIVNDGTLISMKPAPNTDSIKFWDVKLDKPLDSSIIFEVSFVEGSSSLPPKRVLRDNSNKDSSLNSASTFHPSFFDGLGAPTIGDWSYMERGVNDGWVCNSAGGKEGDDDPRLFWLPPANRTHFWWPRITAMMNTSTNDPVTRIDFSRFVHGENWHLCGESPIDPYKKHNP